MFFLFQLFFASPYLSLHFPFLPVIPFPNMFPFFSSIFLSFTFFPILFLVTLFLLSFPCLSFYDNQSFSIYLFLISPFSSDPLHFFPLFHFSSYFRAFRISHSLHIIQASPPLTLRSIHFSFLLFRSSILPPPVISPTYLHTSILQSH